MAGAAAIFAEQGVSLDWSKRFKVFSFDREQIDDWAWEGKLVVQRYDSLEPMVSGQSAMHCVGSTMLDMADQAGKLLQQPILYDPKVIERPRFDGDMRTMERMIPDLIGLFRFVKDVVRQTWQDAPNSTTESEEPTP